MIRKDIKIEKGMSLIFYRIGNYTFNCKMYTCMVEQFLDKISNKANTIIIFQNNMVFNYKK